MIEIALLSTIGMKVYSEYDCDPVSVSDGIRSIIRTLVFTMGILACVLLIGAPSSVRP